MSVIMMAVGITDWIPKAKSSLTPSNEDQAQAARRDRLVRMAVVYFIIIWNSLGIFLLAYFTQSLITAIYGSIFSSLLLLLIYRTWRHFQTSNDR